MDLSNKQPASFRLSEEALMLADKRSTRLGRSRTLHIEILIREDAKKDRQLRKMIEQSTGEEEDNA